MPFENFNPFKKEGSEDSKKTKEQKQRDNFDPSRREFLKKGAIFAGGVALSGTLWKLLEDETDNQKQEDTEKPKKNNKPEKELETATQEQEKIEQENITSLSEVLDYDKEEKIELNSETIEAIKNYWKERYKNDPELRNSLEQAYYNIGEWQSYLKEQFQAQGVPEKYIYLAIPESHWQLEAKSKAGAVGPYQFVPNTARDYGLKTNYFADYPRNLEERKDPIKSAKSCAKLLKDLYNAGGSWNLAFSGYNGGYFWHYLKNVHKKEGEEEISYQGFLNYLEDKINQAKREIISKDYNNYEVRPGEVLTKIADKFNTTEENLCRINNIEDKNEIYAGQILKIPILEKTKKNIFENKIKGMAENLNYPPKFNAIYELIQENFVQDQKQPISFKNKEVTYDIKTYTFKRKDDNINQVSKKFSGVNYKDILRANPDINPAKLHGGEELVIPNKNGKPTLASFAKQNNKDLETLKKLED